MSLRQNLRNQIGYFSIKGCDTVHLPRWTRLLFIFHLYYFLLILSPPRPALSAFIFTAINGIFCGKLMIEIQIWRPCQNKILNAQIESYKVYNPLGLDTARTRKDSFACNKNGMRNLKLITSSLKSQNVLELAKFLLMEKPSSKFP